MTLWNHWGYIWCVIIPQCWYMEHGLKYITFYFQKHIAPLTMCYNPLLVCNKLLGAPAFVKLVYCWYTGDTSKPPQYKDVLPDIGISIIKIIVSWSSCLYNGNPYTWNDSLYWNRAQSSTEPLILALSYPDVLCVIFRWRRRSHYVYGSPWPSQPNVVFASVPQPTHVQKGKHGMIFLTLNMRVPSYHWWTTSLLTK